MFSWRIQQWGVRLVSIFVAVSVIGAGCTKAPDAATAAASKRATLTIWGVLDDQDVYQEILQDYRRLHPYVSIEFRRFRLEEYEDELLNALAEDKGPDVFLIHNTWIGKYLSKIQPMPATTKVAVQTVQGSIRKDVVYQLKQEKTVTNRQFKADYPDTVIKDCLREVNVSPVADQRDFQQRVVAVPLSVDTLGLYVNKDLLNAAGVSTIPETWEAFQQAMKKLVKQDEQGEIVQSGGALGTGFNVERAPDLISVLMMQNGAEMVNDDGEISFPSIPDKLRDQREEPPAYQALQFYTDFANPAKEVYTWNNKQPNSLDAFIQGKAAFFFGYSYHLPIVQTRAPKLNLAISRLPQIEGNPVVNFANYWTWTVSKKSKNVDLAWNLINFMRTPDESAKYLQAAGRPTALRSQIADQLEDEDVGVFASQILTSQSWYRGTDPKAADAALITMVETILAGGTEEMREAVRIAAEKISQTFSSP